MTHFKHAHYRTVAMLVVLGGPRIAFADDTALQAVQAEQAQALTQYFQNLSSNPGQTPAQRQAALNSQLSVSSAHYAQLASDRQKQNDAMIFNRVFLPNGTSVETTKFDANPEAYLNAMSNPKPSVGATQRGLASATPIISDSSGSVRDKLRPQFTLDGTNIPKEIQFTPRTGSKGSLP